MNWKDLTDDPKALFRAMAPKSFDTSSLSDAELRDLAHYLGRAMIMTSSLMVEGEEPADALRRLPTGESVAQALGVTLTDEDRRAVERMAPIYRRRLDDLVPVAIADANALALAQYDRGEYSISMKSGGKLEEAPFTGDHPQGLHSWCTTVACMRTPYTISFEFDSGRYPGLESVFQQIADIKKEMRAEIVEHLQAW